MKTIVFDGTAFACKRMVLIEKKIKDNPKVIEQCLRVFLVGNNPTSKMYLGLKKRLFLNLGIGFDDVLLSDDTTPEQLVNLVRQANSEDTIKGIVVQLPLPDSWTELEIGNVLDAISPDKDIDCLTSTNQKLLISGHSKYVPATVKAVLLILKSINIDKNNISKYKTCILGKSNLVGKPLTSVLSDMGAEVACCDEYTKNISEITLKSDIVISATGAPGLLKAQMIKPEAIVIDVGEPRGDIDFENVKKTSSFITPVPGGVGPVTVVCLLDNFVSSVI